MPTGSVSSAAQAACAECCPVSCLSCQKSLKHWLGPVADPLTQRMQHCQLTQLGAPKACKQVVLYKSMHNAAEWSRLVTEGLSGR